MEHEHTHPHVHTHEDGTTHSHPHMHGETAHTAEETKALLKYMIQHNEHHNEELAELLGSLPVPAQKRMLTAIGAFEAANAYLESVLECLE